MTHDSYRELIQRELDGDLSPEETAILEQHVATCADCHREWTEYKNLAACMEQLEFVRPERSFVTQMTPDLSQFVQKPKRRFAPTAWRGLSVAAVVALAIGVSTQWGFFMQGDQPAQDAHQVALAPEPNKTAVDSAQLQTPQANGTPQQQTTADKQSEPKLIAQETVAEKPSVQAVAVAPTDLGTLQDQTGAKVEPLAPQVKEPVQHPQKEVVVATVDATPTHVKVEGDRVTVTLVPDSKPNGAGGSEVHVYGVTTSSPSDTHTITFTDPDGKVIGTTQVDLGERPSSSIIGKTDRLNSALGAQVQQAAKSDPAYKWTTDPVQVVKHYLSNLGFSEGAAVTASGTGLVQVTQGGAVYEVGLIQPYDQGTAGIWRPVQIGQLLQADHMQPYEKPILDYFQSLKQAGTYSLYVVERTEKQATVTVRVEQRRASAETAAYTFELNQDQNGAWTLVGNAPLAQ